MAFRIRDHAWSGRPSKDWGWRVTDRFTYLDDTGGLADDSITRLTTYWHNEVAFDTDYRFAKKWKALGGMAYAVRDYDDPFRGDWYTLAPMWGLEWTPDGPNRWTVQLAGP